MDFNTRFYLIESVQQILKSFTDETNCALLYGLDIIDSSLDPFCDIKIKLSPGRVIVDSTLIEFPDEFEIGFNLADLVDSADPDTPGSLILSVSFRYLRTSRKNIALVSLKYLNHENKCGVWFPERDKLVLYRIFFNRQEKEIIAVCSDYQVKEEVVINGITYEIKPYGNIIKNIRPLLARIP